MVLVRDLSQNEIEGFTGFDICIFQSGIVLNMDHLTLKKQIKLCII